MIPRFVPLRDEAMFQLAMRHRSATNEPVTDSYERLEFFGDSVLGLVIAQYLYENHPNWDQGMLSKAKSSVVQEGPLAERALALGFDKTLELSPGEESTAGRTRPSILADVFEAVIGAIYLESGMEVARWYILEQLDPYLTQVSTGDVNPYDFKSKLQEIVQATWQQTPLYKVTTESGLAHDRRFHVQVLVSGESLGDGWGRSKKEAEQQAAKDALEIIENSRRAREFAAKERDLD